MNRRRALIFGLAALGSTAPAAAHHSFSAIFDAAKPVTLTGTVTRLEWMNPHTWIYLDVKNDNGSVEAWAFEMGSPNRLMRYGWNQTSLPTGATVTITGSQARDGSLKAAVDTVTLPDGKRLFGAQDTSN
jgi:DNA/RNA endonuclease YhcR with UshA esterase domain